MSYPHSFSLHWIYDPKGTHYHCYAVPEGTSDEEEVDIISLCRLRRTDTLVTPVPGAPRCTACYERADAVQKCQAAGFLVELDQ